MIIFHQDNVFAYAGGHTYWFLPQQMFLSRVGAPSAAGGDDLIAQYSSLMRGIFSRVHGRVN